MNPLLAVPRVLRLPVLLAAMPYAWVWMRELDSGPWVLPIAYAALIIASLVGLDLAMLEQGRDRPLTLRERESAPDPAGLRLVRTAAYAVTAIAAIAAFAVSHWLLAVAIIVCALASMALGLFETRRLLFSEIVWPATLFVLPATIISMIVGERGLDQTTIAATAFGALLIGVRILILLLRDADRHLSEGVATLVTVAGDWAAALLALLCSSAAIVLGIWASVQGWWHFAAVAALAVLAQFALWCLATRRHQEAVLLWWLTEVAAALIIASTILTIEPATA